MSRLGHLTEQRKQFVEAYCRLGNGTLAAKEAGYKNSPSLPNQASKLKRLLASNYSRVIHQSSFGGGCLSGLIDINKIPTKFEHDLVYGCYGFERDYGRNRR